MTLKLSLPTSSDVNASFKLVRDYHSDRPQVAQRGINRNLEHEVFIWVNKKINHLIVG